MVKITYDEDDKEATEMIESYFWFKYFIRSLHFDWKDLYDRRNKETYKIIISNINEYDLITLTQIYKKYIKRTMGSFKITDETELMFMNLFMFDCALLEDFKDSIEEKYKDE